MTRQQDKFCHFCAGNGSNSTLFSANLFLPCYERGPISKLKKSDISCSRGVKTGKLLSSFTTRGAILLALLSAYCILAKLFGKKYKNKQNLTGAKNYDIYFCLIFDHYCQKIISVEETGY